MRDDSRLEQKDDRYYTRSEKEEDFFTIQDDNFPLMPFWLHVGHKIMLGAALVQK